MTITEPDAPQPLAAEEELVQTAATQLRDLVEVNRSATTLYKALAVTLVQIRKICTTRDGKPDVAGRTQHYRDLVARVYAEAGVPPDDVSPLQATIRYHVGNAVRELFTAEEVASAGLSMAGPRDRLAQAVREAGGQADVVHALEEVVQAIDLRSTEVEADPNAILTSVVGMLERCRVLARDMEEVDRRQLFITTTEVARALTALMNDLTLSPTPAGTGPPGRTGRAA